MLELSACCLTNSGRLWYPTLIDVLVNRHSLTWSKLDYTLYYPCDVNQRLKFIFAIQIGDYMYTCTESELKIFGAFLESTFDISKYVRGKLEVIGCKIPRQQVGSIKIPQDRMLRKLDENYLLETAGPKGDREVYLKKATA